MKRRTVGWGRLRVVALLAVGMVACGPRGETPKKAPQPGTVIAHGDAGTPTSPVATGGDAGTGGITFGTPGPWPVSNVTFGAANGILEGPIVGMSSDEAENLWVATHSALYLLQPGQSTFRRFDASSGLHLAGNPVAYCDWDFGDGACPIYGAASGAGISEIAGGGPNEVFVGYYGTDSDNPNYDDPARHTGKMDRVRLNKDGTIHVDRFDFMSSDNVQWWHNRIVDRILFDHFVHPHDLYVGFEHGVDFLRPDNFTPPPPGKIGVTDLEAYNDTFMSDHLHPVVCYHAACTGNESKDTEMMGDWRGLALQPNGWLWVAGRWTAGAITYDNNLAVNGQPNLAGWQARNGSAFSEAFGDPYNASTTPVGSGQQPVFRPPQEGDPVDMSAVVVAPNGLVWFASGPNRNWYPNDPAYGVATWDGTKFTHYDPMADLGMAEEDVSDLAVLPDGRVVLAGPTTGLTLYNPATHTHTAITGLPDGNVLRIQLDTMVSPPALYVATATGATMIRVFPQ